MKKKFVLIIGDGMADRPCKALGGKTPLQAARKPFMDVIAEKGTCGLNQTVKPGFEPGSDVATLGLLGYDASQCYTGRAPIEAAAMGIGMDASDIAVRTNLVCIREGFMTDYSAGRISSEEAKKLIQAVDKRLGKKGGVEFFPGVSYRNMLLLRKKYSDALQLTPPHDISGKKVEGHLPKAKAKEGKETAELLNRFISESQEFLPEEPVNRKRVEKGELPANSLWFWGQGRKPRMESFQEKYGLKGAVISAVDLIKGIGVLTGMTVIKVPGATGYLDTNYEGKARAALLALERHDFVVVHVEATDETGHEGEAGKKVKAVEELDSRIVRPILEGLENKDWLFAVAVSPDHETPVETKTHGTAPVPFAIWRKGEDNQNGKPYDEKCSSRLFEGDAFMQLFLGK